jgi:hypothetical protein
LRLTRAAELERSRRRSPTMPSLRSTGGASAPTIRSSASYARSDAARVSWARFPTGNRRLTSPRLGSGIELLKDQERCPRCGSQCGAAQTKCAKELLDTTILGHYRVSVITCNPVERITYFLMNVSGG